MAGTWIKKARTFLLGGSLLLATSGCGVFHGRYDDGYDPYCGESECDGRTCHRPQAWWPFHLGPSGGGGNPEMGEAQPPAVSPNPRMFPVPTRPVFASPGHPLDESAGRPRLPSSPRTARRPLDPRIEPKRNIPRPIELDDHGASAKSPQVTPSPAAKPASAPFEMTEAVAPAARITLPVAKKSPAPEAPKSTLVMRVLDEKAAASLDGTSQQITPASYEEPALEAAHATTSDWKPVVRGR